MNTPLRDLTNWYQKKSLFGSDDFWNVFFCFIFCVFFEVNETLVFRRVCIHGVMVEEWELVEVLPVCCPPSKICCSTKANRSVVWGDVYNIGYNIYNIFIHAIWYIIQHMIFSIHYVTKYTPGRWLVTHQDVKNFRFRKPKLHPGTLPRWHRWWVDPRDVQSFVGCLVKRIEFQHDGKSVGKTTGIFHAWSCFHTVDDD